MRQDLSADCSCCCWHTQTSSTLDLVLHVTSGRTTPCIRNQSLKSAYICFHKQLLDEVEHNALVGVNPQETLHECFGYYN